VVCYNRLARWGRKPHSKGDKIMEMNEKYMVYGYNNSWTVIDMYSGYALLEDFTHRDKAWYLVVKQHAKIEEKIYIKKGGEQITCPTIMDVVCEASDDLIATLEDECLI
jgi:hypothetical protein